jgi:K+-sensing histidine kinase KdpD
MTWCFLAEVADRSIGTKVHDCTRQNRSNDLDSALILIKEGSARAKIRVIMAVLDGQPSNSQRILTTEASIALRAEQTEGMVRVFVVETGIGIPQEALERIFEGYFQYDPETSIKWQHYPAGRNFPSGEKRHLSPAPKVKSRRVNPIENYAAAIPADFR